MVKLENGVQCTGPLIFREGVQTPDGRFKILVYQEAQTARHFQAGDLLCFLVHPTEQVHVRHGQAVEMPFQGSELGGLVFGAGILGALAGGFAADAGHRTGKRGGLLVGAIIAGVVALPAALFPIMPNTGLFAATLFVLLLGGTITGLVTATALAVLLPNELRGLSIGVFLAIGGLVAFGIAPTLVTVVSGFIGGESKIGLALAMVGSVVSAIGCGGFVVARRRAPQPVR